MTDAPEKSELSAEELDALEKVARAATPGPWQNGIDDLEGVVAPYQPGLGNVICIPPLKQMYSSLEHWPENASFIATFDPPTALRLIAAAREEGRRSAPEPAAPGELPPDVEKQLRMAVQRATLTYEDGTPYGVENAANDAIAIIAAWNRRAEGSRPSEGNLQKMQSAKETSGADIAARIASDHAASDAPCKSEWQDIASAPRDGTAILVFAPGEDPRWSPRLSDLVSVCAWHPDAGFCVCELREPTHWMPMPTPPAESGAGVCQGSEADTAQGNPATDAPSLPDTSCKSEGDELCGPVDHARAYAFCREWLSADYDPEQHPEWRNLARSYLRLRRSEGGR